MVLLALLGCHLFTPISITCVAGMTCAQDSGDTATAIDTGTADTAGSDTGAADTAAAVATVGMAWLGTDAAGTAVGRTFSADGTPRADTVPASPVPSGPFDVDLAGGTWLFAMTSASGPATAVAAYTANGLGAWVTLPDDDGDGTVEPALQIELVDGIGYVLTRAAVYRFDPADGTGGRVTVGPLLSQDVPVGFAVDVRGRVRVVTRNASTGALVVYTFSPASGNGYTNTGYVPQANNGAARAVAIGPDEAPYVCETDGTVRPALGDGSVLSTPVVSGVRLEGNEPVTDVTACAWDAGDASWRLFSPTHGFLHAMGGAASVLVAPDATMASLSAGAFD
ncbi:MAG: hypothetical protein RLZZ299_2176 [Pseudomonadota bacterium]